MRSPTPPSARRRSVRRTSASATAGRGRRAGPPSPRPAAPVAAHQPGAAGPRRQPLAQPRYGWGQGRRRRGHYPQPGLPNPAHHVVGVGVVRGQRYGAEDRLAQARPAPAATGRTIARPAAAPPPRRRGRADPSAPPPPRSRVPAQHVPHGPTADRTRRAPGRGRARSCSAGRQRRQRRSNPIMPIRKRDAMTHFAPLFQ